MASTTTTSTDLSSSTDQPNSSPILSLDDIEIVNVWDDNFEEELYKIMDLIEEYNIISLDTEFPGVVRAPVPTQEEKEYEYKLIEGNVNSMKVIQIGISLANEKGEVPLPCNTWQFNFKYDLNNETNISEAIELLKKSGIDFKRFSEKGIQYHKFSELFFSSGIVLNENIKWLSFHGSFDFAYVLKLLINEKLPSNYEHFSRLLNVYFPSLYDLKFLIQDFDSIRYDGLSRLGYDIKIKRIGPQHQAGSDSLLTLACFFKLKEDYYKNELAFLIRSHNILFGLGKGFCERYNHNRNKTPLKTMQLNELTYIYAGMYNNTSPNKSNIEFYNSFVNYGNYMNDFFNRGLLKDINPLNLNLNQLYIPHRKNNWSPHDFRKN